MAFGDFGFGGGFGSMGGRVAAPLSELNPFLAEDPGMLTSIADAGLSGLGWIGESLDKALGGRTIRGFFDEGGVELGDFAHLIPFSDTLGLTAGGGLFGDNLLANKDEVPSGQEINQMAGIEFGTPWLDIPAGIVTEIGLDPVGTGLTGGLTKAGVLAKALGRLPKRSVIDPVTEVVTAGKRALGRQPLSSVLSTDDLLNPALRAQADTLASKTGDTVEDLLDQPMRASVNFGLPFSSTPLFSFDLPGAAGRADLYDKLGGALRTSYPGRLWTRLWDADVSGVMPLQEQLLGQAAGEAKRAEQATFNVGLAGLHHALGEVGIVDDEAPSIVRSLLEREAPELGAPKLGIAEAVDRALEGRTVTPQGRERLLGAVNWLHDRWHGIDQEAAELGVVGGERVSDKIDKYFRKNVTKEGKPDYREARHREIREVPSNFISKVSVDPELHEINKGLKLAHNDPRNLGEDSLGQYEQLRASGFDIDDLSYAHAERLLKRGPTPSGENVNVSYVAGHDPWPFSESVGKIAEEPHRAAEPIQKPNWEVARQAREHVLRLPEMGWDDARFAQHKIDVAEAKNLKRAQSELADLQERARTGAPFRTPEQQLQDAEQELASALLSRGALDVSKVDAALADKITNENIREMAALLDATHNISNLRETIRELQLKQGYGTHVKTPAELIDEATEKVTLAEVAKARLDADKVDYELADYLVGLNARMPDDLVAEGKGIFSRDPLLDVHDSAMAQIQLNKFHEQLHKHAARNVTRGKVNPDDVPLLDALRTWGFARNTAATSSALRKFAEESLELGRLTPQEFENMAGPRAVMTTGMSSANLINKSRRLAADIIEQSKREADALPDAAALVKEQKAADLLRERLRAYATLNYRKGLIDGDTSDKVIGAIERLDVDKIRRAVGRDPGAIADEVNDILSELVEGSPIPEDGLIAFKNMYLPKAVVDGGQHVMKGYQPGAKNPLGEFVDKFTDWWRGHVTVGRPAFLGRNGLSILKRHWDTESYDAAAPLGTRYLAPFKHAHQLVSGQTVERLKDLPQFAGRNLTAKEATQEVAAQAAAWNVAHGAASERSLGEGAEVTAALAEDFGRGIPGEVPMNLDYFKAGWTESSLKPWKKNFINVQMGAKVANYEENVGRMATFIGQLSQGRSFEEAARISRAAHVAYDGVTDVDRSMRRIIPFWAWLRGAVPFTVRELVQRPGGRIGQTIRAVRDTQGFDPTVPDWVSSTASIPLGESEAGDKRFITGFGLPDETLAGFLGAGIPGALSEAASQLNPVIKAPLEVASGVSFFQRGPGGSGRPLDELDPALGRTIANVGGLDEPVRFPQLVEHAAANFLGPYPTLARQLSDTRKSAPVKALNLLTGVKVSDISPAQQDYTLRSKAARAMKEMGAKSYTDVRFTKDQIASAGSSEEAAAMKRFNALNSLLTRRAKARKDEADD